MKKDRLMEQSSINVNKSTALFNLALVIIILGLTLSLSVNTNFLFFKELFLSSIIITLVAMMKLLDLKS